MPGMVELPLGPWQPMQAPALAGISAWDTRGSAKHTVATAVIKKEKSFFINIQESDMKKA